MNNRLEYALLWCKMPAEVRDWYREVLTSPLGKGCFSENFFDDKKDDGDSFNGRTQDFDSCYRGSIP